MIYLDLILGFLKVGLFSFGGAYGAIPLIRDVVLSNQWMSDELLTYMIAVSESTPGPIMINLATYIGNQQAGMLGSIVATFAVVFPSFIIILFITKSMNDWIKKPQVKQFLGGVKPAMIGIILATGIQMVLKNMIDYKAILMIVILGGCLFYPKIKYKLSPIQLIICSGILGVALYTF